MALAAFVRQYAPQSPRPALPARGAPERTPDHPAEDVQAVLTVLGRRDPVDHERPIDLSRTDLTGARLEGANLTGANLTGATLTGARLRGATLTGARLGGTNLTHAGLIGANLTEWSLTDEQLANARSKDWIKWV